MITDEAKYLMERIGYELNAKSRTGWYDRYGQHNPKPHMDILLEFRNHWSSYFQKLATSEFNFDDWSETDLELWDTLKAIELYLFKDDESKHTKIY